MVLVYYCDLPAFSEDWGLIQQVEKLLEVLGNWLEELAVVNW